MNLKARRWQSGVFKGKKTNARWRTSPRCFYLFFHLLKLLSSYMCTAHKSRESETSHSSGFEFHIMVKCLSWKFSGRTARRRVMVSGVRGKGRLGATASALGFSPWVARTWNILWDSLDLVHGKLAVSKRLHLCWRTSQPNPYSIQLNRERRNFSRGKMTFLNGSLVFVF